MIAMLKSDIVWIRTMLLQMGATVVFFAIICLCFADASALAVFAPLVCVSIPFSIMTNLFVIDEANGWQTLRLALPLSRGQVMGGRSLTGALVITVSLVLALLLSVLWCAFANAGGEALHSVVLCAGAGSALAFLMIGILMPVVARCGFTKAVRYLPLLLVVLVAGGALAANHLLSAMAGTQWAQAFADALQEIDQWLTTGSLLNIVLVALVVVAIAALVYTLLCLLAYRIYQTREF